MFDEAKTLCWDCARATGECSWSNHWEHSPVKGWIALETRLKGNKSKDERSFIVISCPQFIRDSDGNGAIRRKNDKNGYTF